MKRLIIVRWSVVFLFVTYFLFGLGCDTITIAPAEKEAVDEILIPAYKVTSVIREPAGDPDRSDEYNYWVIYELENGAWHRIYIKEHPLTDDAIKKAVTKNIAWLRKLYNK